MRKKTLLSIFDKAVEQKFSDARALFENFMHGSASSVADLESAKIAYQELKKAKDRISQCNEQAVISFMEQYKVIVQVCNLQTVDKRNVSYHNFMDEVATQRNALNVEAQQYYNDKMGTRNFSAETLQAYNDKIIKLRVFELFCSNQGITKLEPIIFAFGMLAAHAPTTLEEIFSSYDPDAIQQLASKKAVVAVPVQPRKAEGKPAAALTAEISDNATEEGVKRHQLLTSIREVFSDLKALGLLNGIYTAPEGVDNDYWTRIATLAESTVPCPPELNFELMFSFWKALVKRMQEYEAAQKSENSETEFRDRYVVPGFGTIVFADGAVDYWERVYKSQPQVMDSLLRNLQKLEKGISEGSVMDIYCPLRQNGEQFKGLRASMRLFKVGADHRAVLYSPDQDMKDERIWLFVNLVDKKEVTMTRGGAGYDAAKMLKMYGSVQQTWKKVFESKTSTAANVL